ncbi:carboxypeptidase regulatory-like domain-containing protein [Aquimarina sp. AU474]|uniref:carboxypeptidase regulatory-like domain-containing protein n=1 Tax=Aquimarina sp. AU474 TaxID=2108529 RepID=UPI000D692CBD|nr:carboxypeptidase regulatory-like domain-containing protein [Aquimarina sp. AU474]
MGALIKGKIVDSLYQKPIEEAVITMSSSTVSRLVDIAQVTNEVGDFIWKDLQPGRYQILIVANGYETKEIVVTLQLHEEQDLFIEL